MDGYVTPEELKITKVPSAKDGIKRTPYMEQGIIFLHPAVVIFSGSAGSGKSTVLINLMTKKQFLKDYFDLIYVFISSPDDMIDELKIPKKRVFTDQDKFEPALKTIFQIQHQIISGAKTRSEGLKKSPKILLIFEDIAANKQFLKSKFFIQSAIFQRHLNISSFINTQAFNMIPRKIRLQANALFFFRGGQSENEIIATEYGAPGLSKKEMLALLDYATKERYSFLFINRSKNVDPRERYRKNLDVILRV